MSESLTTAEPTEEQNSRQPQSFYEIRIEGHLDSKWKARFAGLNFILEENGNTLMSGSVVDQAALHGLLRKVRDLGMPLISVTRISPNRADA